MPDCNNTGLTSVKATTRIAAFGMLGWMWFVMVLGCGSDKTKPGNPLAESPLLAMRSAMDRGQWSEAWSYSDAVLKKFPESPEVLTTVARVAHEHGKLERSAELLVEVCRLESFRRETRVQQAMVALVAVGRLHDGMELMEQALKQQPHQYETRLWLFDLYMGSENRVAGLPHGRFLVRQRQISVDLLLSLSNTVRRTQDADPLEQMVQRNPDDQRPRTGSARASFDAGDYQKSIEILQTIVRRHPEYLPAQSLLARALAAAGEFDKLQQWAATQSDSIRAHNGYWIAMGDWSRANQQHAAAARCYWEATQCDFDVAESWSKLTTTLKQLASAGIEFPEELLSRCEQRVMDLSRFDQLRNRFDRTGRISRAIAIDIANTLQALGRLWEAEAWAAVASTLPEDDTIDVEQTRQAILARMQPETPWQVIEGFPELNADLAFLELPDVANSKVASRDAETLEPDVDLSYGYQLVNEASLRGLEFFGRTGDRLDQPGIRLYQTLGCGGGTIDFDLDGWSDLYLVAAGGMPAGQQSAPNALMRNQAGKFQDVSQPSATGDRGFGQGVAVGDVNEDGFPDLLVLNYGDNVLLVNNGDGSFSDRSEWLGPQTEPWSTAGAIADLDGDGLSDLVIVNYCQGFRPVAEDCLAQGTNVATSCTPVMFPAAADVVLGGTSTGGFVDQTNDWQFQPDVPGRGLGIIVGCFDDRPGVDFLVANDMTANHFWSRSLASDPFRFEESAILRGLAGDDRGLALGSMGIACGDLDRDGDLDFYVTNFNKEYNTFHDQQFPGIWQDATASAKLIAPTTPLVGFGTEAIDIDNDGSLELVVSNGHVDIFTRAQLNEKELPRGQERSLYAQPLQVFHRNPNGDYVSLQHHMPGGYTSSAHVGRSLWTIDANRDGLTDLAITHQTEPVALLINRSAMPGDWLELELVGSDDARDAIGASVKVTADGSSWTVARTAGDGYMCSNEKLIRIGLGVVSGECDIEVTWPDGTHQKFTDLATNSSWLVVQSEVSAFQRN